MKFWTSAGTILAVLTTVFAAGHGGICIASHLSGPPPDEIAISGDLNAKPSTRGPELDRAVIGIDSREIFDIQTAAAGFTIAERERIVYMRLTDIISYTDVADPSIYSIRSIRGKPTIYIGDYRFITVYERDAAAAGTDCMSLAKEWLAALKTVLPHVAPYIAVAPPETYEVSVGGTLLFRLRDANGFDSLSARGENVERNVADALAMGVSGTVYVVQEDGSWGVYFNGVHLVNATPEDADLAKVESARALAETWAERFRKALPVIKPGMPDPSVS